MKKGKDLNRSVYGQFIHLFSDLIIEKLLLFKDIISSKLLLQYIIKKVMNGSFDLSLFISNKYYQEVDWETVTNNMTVKFQPDQVVAFKKEQRDSSVKHKPGDKISWVITCAQFQSAPERAEDPMYVIENNLSVDYHYYLQHKFYDSIKVIFEPVIGLQEYKTLFDSSMKEISEQKQLVDYYENKKIN